MSRSPASFARCCRPSPACSCLLSRVGCAHASRRIEVSRSDSQLWGRDDGVRGPANAGTSSVLSYAVVFARMREGPVVIRNDHIDAVIFDMDGGVSDTASVHARAWARMFNRFLRQRASATGASLTPFTGDDYRRYVDGQHR